MTEPVSMFSALVITFNCTGLEVPELCTSGEPTTIQMSILNGRDCFEWNECADKIETILEIKSGDKIVVSIPSYVLNPRDIKRLWEAMKVQR